VPLRNPFFKWFQLPNGVNGSLGLDNDLFAVSASSPSDIWAVGEVVIHYDGSTWTVFTAPRINGEPANQLDGVADISPTDA
jgi:hypothetical protein